MVQLTLHYYGISPWEIEVIYGYMVGRFVVNQNEIEPNDEDYVSYLGIDIPITFSDEFFQWFEYKRWEKIKAVFKEMKRRRGSKNALKIQLNFAGKPNISFVINADEKQWFDNAVEKIDFVLELLPYHLDKLPPKIVDLTYKFHSQTTRWRLNTAKSIDKNYTFKGDNWKVI